MKYYRYYDNILHTNYILRTLIDCNQQLMCDDIKENIVQLEICLRSNMVSEKHAAEPILNDSGPYLSLSINGDPIYHIYKNGKRIEAFATKLELIEDSIVNLPASVLSFVQGKLLLHCSSVLVNGSAYAIVGRKGLGKTTFSLSLSEKMHLLGDDTLMVRYSDMNAQAEVVPSRSYWKVTDETLSSFKNLVSWVSDFYLPSGKYLCLPKNIVDNVKGIHYPFKGLILLERSSANYPSFIKMDVRATKRILIFKNIVGINYFPFEYQQKTKNLALLKIISDLPVFTLTVPNNISTLVDFKEDYIRFFKMEAYYP